MIKRLLKIIKLKGIGLSLTLLSILFVGMLNYIGVFDSLELKMYDYRFHKVRGPLTGLKAADSTWIKKGTDVVLVEVDDESWRLIKEGWPYSRGTVWSQTVENLSKNHTLHIKHYGTGNESRLTGKHETASINDFSYGISDRGASIRIPIITIENGWKGYLEDRRPASNANPYTVASRIIETVSKVS